MEEKEWNRSTQEKIEFIREGSVTSSIYEALVAIKSDIYKLNFMMVALENDLRELKRELNL